MVIGNILTRPHTKQIEKKNDCRPPRPQPAIVTLPTPQKVTFEILEKTVYEPELIIGRSEWYRMFVNVSSDYFCNKAFDATDPKDPSLGERFTEDASRKKIVPYGKFSSALGVRRVCDAKTVWFLANTEEKNKMIISKYSITGDLIYRISFNKPEDTSYINEIRKPSIMAENGYLYFDWVQIIKQSTNVWHIKQILKARVREPK